jgi:catechol 2,3-dioxygenase-like lactoylglutathione lyase family enzyme
MPPNGNGPAAPVRSDRRASGCLDPTRQMSLWLGLGQPKIEEGAMIQTNGVDHVVLHVNNVECSKRFYTEILGMTVYREDKGQVFLHAGEQGGRSVRATGRCASDGRQRPQPSGAQRGGRDIRNPEGGIGEKRGLGERDPDGHRLQLVVHG